LEWGGKLGSGPMAHAGTKHSVKKNHNTKKKIKEDRKREYQGLEIATKDNSLSKQ